MSKKRFTEGLESLFGPSQHENLPEESPLLVETEVKVKSSSKRERKSSSKNFTSDLDTLFEDAFQETIQEKKEEIQKGKSSQATAKRRKTRRPVSGLDALIRRTIEGGEAEISYEARKRVTFVFDKAKVDKLKRIAKSQKVFMKDILKDIVEEYIEEYEKEKGTLN